MRRFRKALVGGTFDLFHAGHRSIMLKAFDQGDFVVVGVTSDEMMKARNKRHRIEPYKKRLEGVNVFLLSQRLTDRSAVVPLNDPYGQAISDPDAEAIVVSPETLPRALEINAKRGENGLKPLTVIEHGFILANDGKPISSSRIRLGLIDREGRVKQRSDSKKLRYEKLPSTERSD